MGEITRTRPRAIKWLAGLSLLAGLGGAAQLVAGLLAQHHLDTNLPTLASMGEQDGWLTLTGQYRADIRASASLAIFMGVLGLVALTGSYLVYTARRGALAVTATAAIVLASTEMISMAGHYNLTYQDPLADPARTDLVNSLIKHPLYEPLLYPAEIVALGASIAVMALLFNENVREFVRIRRELPPDAEWERIIENRRATEQV
jgi:hypothetical protein